MINNLPSNLLRSIFLQLPEEEICKLHNSVCKKFNTVIEGNKDYKPLIEDLDIKLFRSYKIVARFAPLKGDVNNKYTLDEHCHPVLCEGGFLKNLFKKNFCTEKRVRWVVKQIYDFAENSVKNAKKDTFSSMSLAVQRLKFAYKALSQIDWITYHQKIKNSNVDLNKMAHLGSKENWGLKKTIEIQGKNGIKKINLSVCLVSVDSEGFHGSILVDDASKCSSINFSTEIKNKDHLVFMIYSSISENLKIAVKEEIALLAKGV